MADVDTANIEVEKQMAANFLMEINDNEILKRSLASIHRIITMFINDKPNDEEIKQLIDFLFKCLDLYGNDASVLFGLLPVSPYEDYFLKRAFGEYSDKLDLCFLSKEHIQYVFKENEKLHSENEYLQDLILQEFQD